jgi:hypothetical protein
MFQQRIQEAVQPVMANFRQQVAEAVRRRGHGASILAIAAALGVAPSYWSDGPAGGGN